MSFPFDEFFSWHPNSLIFISLIDIPPSSIRHTDSIRTGIGPSLPLLLDQALVVLQFSLPLIPCPSRLTVTASRLPLRRYTRRYLITGLVTKKYSTAITSYSLQHSLGWQWLSLSTCCSSLQPRAFVLYLARVARAGYYYCFLFPRPRLSTWAPHNFVHAAISTISSVLSLLCPLK